jgi:hypothetical protein
VPRPHAQRVSRSAAAVATLNASRFVRRAASLSSCRERDGAQPEVAQRWEAIVSVDNEIKALTDDPNIINPVYGVVIRAKDAGA